MNRKGTYVFSSIYIRNASIQLFRIIIGNVYTSVPKFFRKRFREEQNRNTYLEVGVNHTELGDVENEGENFMFKRLNNKRGKIGIFKNL